jgi:hypothetical protein
MTIKTPGDREDRPAKQRYESPRLESYGDIRVVTEAVAHTSANSDGGAHGTKTA